MIAWSSQLIEIYRSSQEGERGISPAEVEVVPVIGRLDPERICTSIVERSNLGVRMGLRRFTLSPMNFKEMETH
jgi:hypothetical protein